MEKKYTVVILLFILTVAVFPQQQSSTELLEHNPQTLYTDKVTTPPIDEDALFFEQGAKNFDITSEKINEYELLPPLSIDDSITILDKCRDILILIQKDKTQSEKDLALAVKIIDNVIDYAQIIDERNETLAYYRWDLIGEQKVSEPYDIDIYPINPPIKHINAISFTASNNLVHIIKIKIADSNNTTSEFKIDKWISNQLPGKQVCFLPIRQNIARIEIEYASKPGEAAKNPQVAVYAGVTRYPEFAKRAIYYLRLARHDIESNDLKNVLDRIYRAKSSLNKYKATRIQ